MMNIGTMLIVAHRLSTIQHADNIIVLSNGKSLNRAIIMSCFRNTADTISFTHCNTIANR